MPQVTCRSHTRVLAVAGIVVAAKCEQLRSRSPTGAGAVIEVDGESPVERIPRERQGNRFQRPTLRVRGEALRVRLP